MVEIQVTLQEGYHLEQVNYSEIHENYKLLWVQIKEDLDNQGSDNQGCNVAMYIIIYLVS